MNLIPRRALGVSATEHGVAIGGSNNGQIISATNLVMLPTPEALPSMTSQLAVVIVSILGQDEGAPVARPSVDAFKITDKLSHNSLVRYRPLIESYGDYAHIVERCYSAIEESQPGVKTRFLKIVQSRYVEERATLLHVERTSGLAPIEVIRANADYLFESLQVRLKNEHAGSNLAQSIYSEEAESSINMLLGHAFVECRIFEKPSP